MLKVSTHSRPKAADGNGLGITATACFNTQPPEGGCGAGLVVFLFSVVSTHSRPKAAVGGLARFWLSRPFQHTAARRRLVREAGQPVSGSPFQHTAARRRLQSRHGQYRVVGGFNTQPPEGGCLQSQNSLPFAQVSTHSRPKASEKLTPPKLAGLLYQHTAARRRLVLHYDSVLARTLFQHTAARRRLVTVWTMFETIHSFQHTAARRRLRPGRRAESLR